MNPAEGSQENQQTPAHNGPIDTTSIYPQVDSSQPQPNATNRTFTSNLPTQTTPNRIGKKNITLVIILILIVIPIAIFVYDHYIYQKLHTVKGAVVGHSYINHKVSVGGQTFNISFDKSSESRNPDSNQLIMLGNDLKGNRVIVTLGRLTPPVPMPPKVNPTLCEGAAATLVVPLSQRNYINAGNVNILGSIDTLCAAPPSSPDGPFSTAYVEFSSNNSWYTLTFSSIDSSNQSTKNLDINSVKTIAQSLNRV